MEYDRTVRQFYAFCTVTLLLVAACALAGCGQDRIHDVPTPVACVKSADVPAEPPTIHDKLTGNAAVDLTIVASSALDLRDWGEKEHALLTGCQ